MNEQIKEIFQKAQKCARDYVEECKHYGYYMEHNEYEVRFAQKFAELMIKECEDCIGAPSWPRGTIDVWDSGLRWAVYQIKQHFGVL